jgi:hypothetical protein
MMPETIAYGGPSKRFISMVTGILVQQAPVMLVYFLLLLSRPSPIVANVVVGIWALR